MPCYRRRQEAEMPIEFRILGPLEVSADGRLFPLGSPKQRALLGLLLVHANETLSRDRMIEELWGEAAPATVESAFHSYLSRLRRQLNSVGASGLLVRQAHGYRLRVEPDQLDVTRFEHLVDEGSEALAARKAELAADRFRQALALWRGPALADLQSERFAVTASARLEDAHVSALEQRLEADLALARHRQLIGELETLVSEHPYRERLRAQLMLALYRSGRQAEALRAYQQARRMLADELGLEPSQELKELEHAMLRQDPRLAIEPSVKPQTEPEPAPPPLKTLDVEEQRSRRRIYAASAALILVAAVVAIAVVALGHGSEGANVEPNSVAVVDPGSNKVVEAVRVGIRPAAIAAGEGALWVANLDDRTISRIDPDARTVRTNIPLEATPTGVAVGAHAVWVANGLLGKVTRIDPEVNAVVHTIDVVSFRSTAGSVSYGYGAVWAAFGSGDVAKINPTDNRVLHKGVLGAVPSAIAVGEGSVWVANASDNTVSRVNPRIPSIVYPLTVGRRPLSVAVGYGAVWVANEADDSVTRLDAASASSESIPLGERKRPVGVAVGAGAVWVANAGDGTISRIDPDTNDIVKTIDIGNRPSGVIVAYGDVWVTVEAQA
jgi:YVTN family beta-propeller protein